ncbi:hypothetical protein MMC20_003175 [Loxospora ochrophaea]|nr:hypothetical protein [Loxospora ochrophaea]
MGQSHSKRTSDACQQSLTGDLSKAATSPSEEPDSPDSVITRPGWPRRITRLSELIDPLDLISDDGERPRSDCDSHPGAKLIESPSGNLLGAKEYAQHPNRPLTVRERKERIRAALEMGESAGITEERSVADVEREGANSGKGGKYCLGGCFGRGKG